MRLSVRQTLKNAVTNIVYNALQSTNHRSQSFEMNCYHIYKIHVHIKYTSVGPHNEKEVHISDRTSMQYCHFINLHSLAFYLDSQYTVRYDKHKHIEVFVCTDYNLSVHNSYFTS